MISILDLVVTLLVRGFARVVTRPVKRTTEGILTCDNVFVWLVKSVRGRHTPTHRGYGLWAVVLG